MKKTIFIISIFLIIGLFTFCVPVVEEGFMELLPQEEKGYIPPDGFVPDKETAIKIAEAVWLPIYGRKVTRQKPYRVKLIDERIWLVKGSVRGFFTLGGEAYIEIDKYTGEILKVTHSR